MRLEQIQNLTYDEFVSGVKELGVTELWRETSEYDGIDASKQLYAVLNKQLVGSYSDAVGGVIFIKPSVAWRTTGRTFEKQPI